MATRAQDLSRLLERSAEGIAAVLVQLADETVALGGDDPGALRSARRWATAAHELDPRNRDAWLALARTAAQQEDYVEAERALKAVLSDSPSDCQALHEMGMLREEQGDVTSARRYFARALRAMSPSRHPWAALLFLSAAELDLGAGRRAAAIRCAREGVRRLQRHSLDVGVLVDFLKRMRS